MKTSPSRYRQLSTQYAQAAQRLAQHSTVLPSPMATWVQQFPKIALAIAIGIGGIGLLIVLNPVLRRVTLFLSVIGLYLGSWVWLLIHRKRKGQLTSKAVIFSVVSLTVGGFVPFLPHLCLLMINKEESHVRRGARLVSAQDLIKLLAARQEAIAHPIYPLLEIGGIPLPNDLENLGFFFVGSPGSGKTQAIKRLLATLKARPDFRVMLLDRSGELLESFYDECHDLIFNPSDVRSIQWSHATEGLEAETISASLVPDDSKERFFSEAAKSLLADLYERCETNAEVWEVISTFTMEDLHDFLRGGVSARYFETEKTGASVLSTLVNSMRFYRRLPDAASFSFSTWGRENDPRWLFLPVFEDTAERYKALYSMAFELMLKGLLSQENRTLKTAIVIDELGALNHLPSLARLLSESRKFGGTAILGTQTEAQIDKVYGENDRRIILQGTATKLILNCRDEKTAERMAELIGKQERLEYVQSRSSKDSTRSEQIRDTYAVMPAELQQLPSLEGYLTIADGTPSARVRVEPQRYPVQVERLIAVV